MPKADRLQSFVAKMSKDIDNVIARDPAARSRTEVALCYPGVHAIWAHRAANSLWRKGYKLAARILAEISRRVTGIEIHPAAHIGPGLFIDHGMAVVIGETAVVGKDVTMYHGVTLGGLGSRRGQRHPRIGDRVVLGAGAKILGSIVIGDDSRIGANVVVTQSIPPNTVIRSAAPSSDDEGTATDAEPAEVRTAVLESTASTARAKISRRASQSAAPTGVESVDEPNDVHKGPAKQKKPRNAQAGSTVKGRERAGKTKTAPDEAVL